MKQFSKFSNPAAANKVEKNINKIKRNLNFLRIFDCLFKSKADIFSMSKQVMNSPSSEISFYSLYLHRIFTVSSQVSKCNLY